MLELLPANGAELTVALVECGLAEIVRRAAPTIEVEALVAIGELRNERSIHDYGERGQRFELVWDRLSYPSGDPEVRIEVEAKTSTAVRLLDRVDAELRAHFGPDLERLRRGKVKELCLRMASAGAAT